jgi:hypothetical protein
MPFRLKARLLEARVWEAGSKTGVRATFIVVSDPRPKNLPDMVLIKWNHEIQTLSPRTANQTLAKCVACGER